jgi:S-adenosylmethionine:tRNA ribosyltransferase-isomerase
MKTSDFDYELPPERIAQTPLEPRDQSRLMVLNRRDRSLQHRRFFEIGDFLQTGDVLVFNDSRVIPARLSGKKTDSEGKVELLLLRRLGPDIWETLVKPGRRVRIGTSIEIGGDAACSGEFPRVTGEVTGSGEGGMRVIRFSDEKQLSALGQIPLPPYIHTPLQRPERYQTVYAKPAGSVAAPTAGLHFTPALINRIADRGVHCVFVTLHIGLDTFQPVREDDPTTHPLHREYGIVSQEAASELSLARREGRRIVCVGTTSVRLLEAVAQANGPTQIQPFADWVNLFILPGYKFRLVDALVTNFHLPKSTLLMLVIAFAGKELISQAYQEAIAQQYRFYSFGDAMLVI